MISSFFEVWDTVLTDIEGKVINTNNQSIIVPCAFFNKQPILKNSEVDFKYPKMVVRFFTPIESKDLIINEKFIQEVTVDDRAPYIEGVKAPSITINDGDTLILERGFENPADTQDTEIQTVTFQSSDFASPPTATVAEILAVLQAQLTGVSVTLEPSDTIRILHDTVGSYSTLRVVGTATNLVTTFPTILIAGRDAGLQIQRRDPPLFYNFLFHITHQALRFDHYSELVAITERMFRLFGTPNLRSIALDGNRFSITRGLSVDDPLVSEGVFITTVPYTLRNVPIDLDAAIWDQDNFNGGNGLDIGCGPLDQAPPIDTFELNFDPVASDEPL